MICLSCSNSFETKFCPACGTAAAVKRIDSHYVVHELQHDILHMEKGFLFTVKELTLRPGQAVRRFLEGSRSKYYKPIGFLIICSIIYPLVSHWIGKPPTPSTGNGNIDKINQWVETHYSYANLIEILFIALALKWFFGKKQYNYFEHLVLLSYLTGYAMLAGALLMLVSHAAGIAFNDTIFLVLAVGYTVWAIGMFYKAASWTVYAKALLAYMTGFMLVILLEFVLALTLMLLHVQL
jgi:Protein of unknown function (DUF3667)